MIPPLIFEPILKRIRWGGRKLGTLLDKPIGDASDYAESWEIADHADGQSIVASGPLAGKTLAELIKLHPDALLGKQSGLSQFPLLIKFLDANDWLSLQVHPDDQLARQFSSHENGKTEAWVILDAAPDSQICAGLKSHVTPELLRESLDEGHVKDCLHLISVKPGDCIFVPAGTVHALGPGIVLAEIQQQSNLTFRLYDWGRLDASGLPRPVHIDQSIICTDFRRGPVEPRVPISLCDESHAFEELVRCEHFVIRRHLISDPIRIETGNRFRILIFLKGRATVETQFGSAQPRIGSTVLLPACSGQIRITPRETSCLLEVLVP